MSENPFQAIFLNLEKISHGVQTLLSQFAGLSNHQSSPPTNGRRPLFSLASSFNPNPLNASSNSSVLLPKELTNEGKSATPVTKEELGRATWIFLHTLAAQMDILSRMYPCKECADHFKEILRANPVQVGSQAEFSQWLCHVHNVVNRSLGKVVFSCERVDAKWGKLDCEQRTCDLQGNTKIFGDKMQ
ncbi:FAD-linked sulfhydryl oxidase ERV1-like isoform X2 [Rhododendron vialii]|uniref:FAD-linked sulfhydryl oxidase ERV1-like isoform X2 n=1 Tax=Rhododendron vialii TaxID=182163 RepID=UPI00265E8CCA|nr:FAD-linked sulfhydryl oxidase ERV1-like isoform X2 [Rhododendron vialii]